MQRTEDYRKAADNLVHLLKILNFFLLLVENEGRDPCFSRLGTMHPTLLGVM